MIAILRFDDDRDSDFLGRFPRIVGGLDRPAFRDWYANTRKQFASQVLVLSNRLGDGRRAIRFRRQNAALLRTESELNQAPFVEPAIRNASRRRGVDDRLRAGTETNVLSQFLEFFDRCSDIERLAVNGGHDQIASDLDGLAADVFLDVLDRDFVDAVFVGLASTAEADDLSGQSLQLNRNVLKNMSQISSASHSLKEAAAFSDAATMLNHRGQPSHQPVIETGNLFGGFVFELA